MAEKLFELIFAKSSTYLPLNKSIICQSARADVEQQLPARAPL